MVVVLGVGAGTRRSRRGVLLFDPFSIVFHKDVLCENLGREGIGIEAKIGADQKYFDKHIFPAEEILMQT